MNSYEFEKDLRDLLKKHGLILSSQPSFENPKTFSQKSMIGGHPIVRDVTEYRLTIHADVDRHGHWYYEGRGGIAVHADEEP